MRRMWRDDSGRGLLEYGLILGLVAMVAIGMLLAIGISTNSTLERLGSTIDQYAGGRGENGPRAADRDVAP